MIKLITMRSTFRSKTGAGIVEGVVGLWLLVFVAIALLGMIANVGAATYYKQKIGFVANQAAQYAASVRCWNRVYNYAESSDPGGRDQQGDYDLNPANYDVQVQTALVVNAILSDMGMPAASSVSVTDTDDGTGIVATINVSGLVMPSSNIALPAVIMLQDSATADLTSGQPPAFVWLGVNGDRDKVVAVPSFGSYGLNGAGRGLKGPTTSNPYNSYAIGITCPVEYQHGSGPTNGDTGSNMDPVIHIPPCPQWHAAAPALAQGHPRRTR